MNIKNFTFKKKFGQNFLVDKNIVNKIINNLNILPNSLVIEIGCGDGRLTKELCKSFSYVLGYEIDLEVKDYLLENLSDFSNYKINFNDFMKCDVLEDLKSFSYDSLYVVANLPYYITTPIIEKLISLNLDINTISVMVQKEVADRFSAKVGSKEYNSLSIYLNYYFDVKKAFDVNRNSFLPKPNVDSSVVCFTKKKDKFNVKNEDVFFKLVLDSFKFKRKTIKNNLSGYDLDIVSSILNKYGYDLSVRAENLPIDVFVDISNNL